MKLAGIKCLHASHPLVLSHFRVVLMRLTTLSFFLLVLSGCVIAPTGTFYKPTYPSGSAAFEGPWCGGGAGPRSVILLPVADDVVLKSQIQAGKDDGMELTLALELMGDADARFESRTIRLEDPATGEKWSVQAGGYYVYQPFTVPPDADLSLDAVVPTDHDSLDEAMRSRPYETSFAVRLDLLSPAHGQLLLPDLVIDGLRRPVPPIAFRKIIDRKVFPYQTEPVVVGDFRIDAEMSVLRDFMRRNIEELMIKVTVEAPAARTWRFATNQVAIVDTEKDQRHAVSFTSLWPKPRINVDFLDPVINRRFVTRTEASIRLRVRDAGLDTLIVRLPTLVIRGERVEFAPITFKRSAGVRIEPFNC
jgi:hypothetical protein